jgi:hypothetical protein
MAFFNGKKSALEKNVFNGQKTTFFFIPLGFPQPDLSPGAFPCFAKIASSGNVYGNVHKTASMGLACAKNTPQAPPMPDHARFVFE